MGVLLTVRGISVVVLVDGDDVNSHPHPVDGIKPSQAAADFYACFKIAGTAPKEAVADQEGQGNK